MVPAPVADIISHTDDTVKLFRGGFVNLVGNNVGTPTWSGGAGGGMFSETANDSTTWVAGFTDGLYKLTYKVDDGTCDDTENIWVRVCSTNSVYDQAFASNINIFPNPTIDVINVSFDEALNTTTEIKLTDLTGRVLYMKEYSEIPAGRKECIDMSQFSAGMYFVKIRSDEKEYVSRVQKQ